MSWFVLDLTSVTPTRRHQVYSIETERVWKETHHFSQTTTHFYLLRRWIRGHFTAWFLVFLISRIVLFFRAATNGRPPNKVASPSRADHPCTRVYLVALVRPWPWPNDLDTRPWPRRSEDKNELCRSRHSKVRIRTRQTDSHTPHSRDVTVALTFLCILGLTEIAGLDNGGLDNDGRLWAIDYNYSVS